MLSFDTNILVYAADRRAAQKRVLAGNLLKAAGQLDAGLTEQCLIEFLHVATRKARQPLHEASRIVGALLAAFRLLVPGESVVTDTLRLLAQHKLSAWDARLLAVCAASGCDVLLSEDLPDNAMYGGVRVLNPFNPENAARIGEVLRQ